MCGHRRIQTNCQPIPVGRSVPTVALTGLDRTLAHSVDCCATLDAVLSGEGFEPIPDMTASDLTSAC